MKWLKVISTLVLLIAFNKVSTAQYNTVEQFTAFEVKGKVQLKWTMTAGSLCNGTAIYRATDTLNYEFIGEISGVCGNITEPEDYNFADASPIYNQKVYYKLEFGGLGEAPVTTITLYNITSGHLVFPNPASTSVNIHFNNTDKTEYEITVYNSKGQKVLTLTTIEDYFHLDVSAYRPGIYHFTISNDEKGIITRGRINIAR